MTTPPLLFTYPPECCAERHATVELLGAEQFARDHAAGWRRRQLWTRFVSTLRTHEPAYRRAYAMGYARAAKELGEEGWNEGVYVEAALAAAAAPPT